MNWTKEGYDSCVIQVREILEKVRSGVYPKLYSNRDEYDRYVLWKGNNDGIWIEFPAQCLEEISKSFDDVIIDVKPFEVGYSFYESAFIRIK